MSGSRCRNALHPGRFMSGSVFRVPHGTILPGKPGQFAVNNAECCHA